MRIAMLMVVAGLGLAACGSPDEEADKRREAERLEIRAKAKRVAEATTPDPTADQPAKPVNKAELIEKCDADDAASCQGACALEHADSCSKFARLFEEGRGGVPENFEAARDFHLKACTFGSGEGCYSLGLFFKLGKSIPKSPERAQKYFAQGCKLGFQPACDEVTEPEGAKKK
jgi:TPR repeat protein